MCTLNMFVIQILSLSHLSVIQILSLSHFLGQEAKGELGRLVVVRRRWLDPSHTLHPLNEVTVWRLQPQGLCLGQQAARVGQGDEKVS